MTATPLSPKPEPPVASKATAEEYRQQAIRYVIEAVPIPDLVKVGKLDLLQGSDDEKHCKDIQRLLRDYINGNESRPISIVVFGPPGSGKSFYVRQLVASLREEQALDDKMDKLSEVNLAQLYTAQDLSKCFKVAQEQEKEKGTKVFFFDEFDSSLEGASLGWLRWFLAPMQDGKFSNGGDLEEIGKSVFIFAGGTAATLNEFQERTRIDLATYREKKVPDFISRLRGFIDIRGINDAGDDRPVRRALILRGYLEKKFSQKDNLPIEADFATRLLSNAHYIHGNRSMEALLEMSSWKNDEMFQEKHLPPRRLMELHVNRGRLNGIMIGISAGLNENASVFLINLSGKLFENGADLAYGGNFVEAGTLDDMVKAARKPPDDLIKRELEEKQRIHNYLGYPAYKDPDLLELHKKLAELHEKVEDQVKIRELRTLSESECKDFGVPENEYFFARPRDYKNETGYNPKQHLAWALSLFRMRVRMIHDINAVIAFGGKDDGQSWGRFSGIAEEIMLALAMGKPVYILGEPGGAAQAVGRLLGLDETMVNPDSCLADIGSIEHSSIYKHFKHAFVLPEQPNLPRTVAEARSFLFEHGITSSAWPWNGLTPAQNRKLFNTKITDVECADLIITGLTRLDWKLPSGPSDKKGPQ